MSDLAGSTPVRVHTGSYQMAYSPDDSASEQSGPYQARHVRTRQKVVRGSLERVGGRRVIAVVTALGLVATGWWEVVSFGDTEILAKVLAVVSVLLAGLAALSAVVTRWVDELAIVACTFWCGVAVLAMVDGEWGRGLFTLSYAGLLGLLRVSNELAGGR